jgi:hypothetical protein
MHTNHLMNHSLVFVVVTMGFGSGCGDSTTEGSGGSTASGGEYSCCLNGEGYDCPDKVSFDKCAGFDFAACDSACGLNDAACHQDCADQAANATHDPSDCDPDPNASACNMSSTSSGSCTPEAIGCESSAECCDGLSCQMDPMSGTDGTFCL